MQAAVDAVVEGAADAVEIAEESAAAGSEALDELFDGAARGVALVDQLSIGGRQVAEADFQSLQARVELLIVVLPIASEEGDQVFAHVPAAADAPFALLEHFEIGKAVGPGEKRLGGVIVGELAIQGDGCFLQGIAGVLLMGEEAENVTKQVLLMTNQQAHELLGFFGFVFDQL